MDNWRRGFKVQRTSQQLYTRSWGQNLKVTAVAERPESVLLKESKEKTVAPKKRRMKDQAAMSQGQ